MPLRIRLILAYLFLLAVVVGGIVTVALAPHVPAVEQYGPNVVADFAGALVAVFLIERMQEWKKANAEAELRTAALYRAWRPLNRLAHLILFMYKASAPDGSARVSDFDHLLTAWQREVGKLDFERSSGANNADELWSTHSRRVAIFFQGEMQRLIDRYLTVLGSDFPATVERVIADHSFEMMAIGIQQANPFNAVSSTGEPIPAAADFAERVRAMHQTYLRLGGPPLTVEDALYDGSPHWGSARTA